jgi:hypothetical protein
MHSPRSRIRLPGQEDAYRFRCRALPPHLAVKAPRAVSGNGEFNARGAAELRSTNVFERGLWMCRCGAGEASDTSAGSWAARAAGQRGNGLDVKLSAVTRVEGKRSRRSAGA